jgi:cyclopropane-fatty-acyl-phospholipid synthase
MSALTQNAPPPKTPVSLALRWAEQGYLPDALIRLGIRRLTRERLREIDIDNTEIGAERATRFIAALPHMPVALVPEAANAQHYEVPAEFFRHALGKHRKYSSAWWPEGVHTLDEAEAHGLAATCEHAGLADGQRILELGCGWGSLTLWMAEHYPRARITAVSNSNSQREHIMAEARRRNLANVNVITNDMNRFEAPEQYDRVVSVEMLEHMRNWDEIFRRVHGWLLPGGRFFMHVFVHRTVPYAFEVRDASDWMSQFFFTGGMMPSDDMALHFQRDLRLLRRWRWDGTHYEKTANAWLRNIDAKRAEVMPVLAATYGAEQAAMWFQRWRIFFMACAELFGYEQGQQWWVSHYLFERPAA